jgi:transcriptional regulator with XRE-family HTH domain
MGYPTKRKYVRRQPSEEFGDYLRELRERNTILKQAEAARKLEIKAEALNFFEQGTRSPPDTLLIKIARLYRVSPEEILAKAYWPQLVLLPLVHIINPERLSKSLIQEIEKGLEEAERKELTEFIEDLLHKRAASLK